MINNRLFLAILITATLIALPAFGDPTPIPAALANGNAWLQFGAVPGNNYNAFGYEIGPYQAGYGGGFQPTISGLNATGDGADPASAQLTTVWCVDYQLDVEGDSSYGAKLETLNNIAPSDPGVRYGTLSTVSSPGGWAHALSGTGTLDPNLASTRYILAAALVSEYENAGSVVDPTQPVNDSRNQAIQEAIWYITYNSEYSSASWATTGIGTPTCSGAFDASNYMCWVGQAESNMGSVDTSAWAVISGPIATTGANKGDLLDPQSNQYQTFLVQVDSAVFTTDNPAPEPGFYGVLTLGMAGLFGVAYRRRRRAQ